MPVIAVAGGAIAAGAAGASVGMVIASGVVAGAAAAYQESETKKALQTGINAQQDAINAAQGQATTQAQIAELGRMRGLAEVDQGLLGRYSGSSEADLSDQAKQEYIKQYGYDPEQLAQVDISKGRQAFVDSQLKTRGFNVTADQIRQSYDAGDAESLKMVSDRTGIDFNLIKQGSGGGGGQRVQMFNHELDKKFNESFDKFNNERERQVKIAESKFTGLPSNFQTDPRRESGPSLDDFTKNYIEENRGSYIPGALDTLVSSGQQAISEIETGREGALRELDVLQPYTEERNPFLDDVIDESTRGINRLAASQGRFRAGTTAETIGRTVGSIERDDRSRRLDLLRSLTNSRANIASTAAGARSNLVSGTGTNVASLLSGAAQTRAGIQNSASGVQGQIQANLTPTLTSGIQNIGNFNAAANIGSANNVNQLGSLIPAAIGAYGQYQKGQKGSQFQGQNNSLLGPPSVKNFGFTPIDF